MNTCFLKIHDIVEYLKDHTQVSDKESRPCCLKTKFPSVTLIEKDQVYKINNTSS